MHPASTLIPLVAALLMAMGGCQPNDNAVELKVTGTLVNSTCGAAVDTDATEEFYVVLTRDDDALSWYTKDTGDQMEGSVDSNDAIELASIRIVQVTDSSGLDPGCAVRRHDAYSGTLKESTANKIVGFDVEVLSTYTEADNYSCDALIGARGGFTDLPCEVTYDLSGTKK